MHRFNVPGQWTKNVLQRREEMKRWGMQLSQSRQMDSPLCTIKAPLYQPSAEGGKLSWGIKRTSPLLIKVSFSFAGKSVNFHASSLGNRVQKYAGHHAVTCRIWSVFFGIMNCVFLFWPVTLAPFMHLCIHWDSFARVVHDDTSGNPEMWRNRVFLDPR